MRFRHLPRRLRLRLALAFALATSLGLACSPEAKKEASIPCEADIQCGTGLTCRPMRNGAGTCIAKACTRACNVDADCRGLRTDSDGAECFACRDVTACANAAYPMPGGGDGGVLKSCIDRCVMQPP